jgi:transcriptional regulator GlxA family with amidase domain
MKHISILVPKGQNNLSSIVGSYKILLRANNYYKEKTNKDLYTIELIGNAKNVSFHNGLFSVKPHKNIAEINSTQLIIIPSLNHTYELAIQSNKKMIDWISVQHQKGAEIACICTGAFFLAATGLLDGKICSTHWAFAELFKQKFPAINLQTDKLITDEAGIYTNGGAFSFLNLILYLVEKLYDRETAIFCAKVFQIEIDRQQQSGFIIFKGQKTHGDELILKTQQYIEKNIHQKISIDSLADKYALGRRTFDRRFIKATGNSPLEYTQRVKIEAAKKQLENNNKNINEIMFEVGYSDEKAFRELFKRITGMSPLEYRSRYGR